MYEAFEEESRICKSTTQLNLPEESLIPEYGFGPVLLASLYGSPTARGSNGTRLAALSITARGRVIHARSKTSPHNSWNVIIRPMSLHMGRERCIGKHSSARLEHCMCN